MIQRTGISVRRKNMNQIDIFDETQLKDLIINSFPQLGWKVKERFGRKVLMHESGIHQIVIDLEPQTYFDGSGRFLSLEGITRGGNYAGFGKPCITAGHIKSGIEYAIMLYHLPKAPKEMQISIDDFIPLPFEEGRTETRKD